MHRHPAAAVLTLLLLASGAVGNAEWPQFRGPDATGVPADDRGPDAWDTSTNVAWKTPIPGLGWSCPVVAGDRVFLTTVVQEGKPEEPKKGLYFGGERAKPPEGDHRWLVLCLDFKTGKVIWERIAHAGKPAMPRHVKNTYASETPVTDGERVYAYFGNLGMYCFDVDGKPLWTWEAPAHRTFAGWGTAASPVLHGEKLIVVDDNEEKSFLAALDRKTGKELWKVDRPEKSNWATPFVWVNDQRTEIVTAGKGKVRSYDLDGKLLWELGGMSTIAIPTPFARHGLLYVSSGYVLDKSRPLFAIKPGASGDVSLGENETSNQHVAWAVKTAGPYNPSPLVYGDYLYVLYDRGFLACYDAKTGKEVYGKQRLAKSGGTAFTASPWAYDGKVFCMDEDGVTYVVKAGPAFEVLRKNPLEEMCMATPAVVRGSLLLRTEKHLYRIEKRE